MSIVRKLQKKCIDKEENLQNLLREALLISSKLKLYEFKEWINCELKGYKENINIPEYREVKQTLKFLNPYHGWISAQVSSDLEEMIGFVKIQQPIGEIEHLIQKHDDNLSISPPAELANMLRKLFKTDFEVGFSVNKTQIFGITEQVRNLLLEWTLKLEEDGILGNDDLVFTDKEKEAAKSIHIENFHGVLGDISKLGNMSTGTNSTNIYNENNINNEIDKLINEIRKLNLKDKEQIILDLNASKEDYNKTKTILGSLLSRGSEFSSISSMIIDLLTYLK